MRVDSVLVREASSLAGRIKSVAPASAALNALVLMSLGLEHRQLLNAVSEAGVAAWAQCATFLSLAPCEGSALFLCLLPPPPPPPSFLVPPPPSCLLLPPASS